MAKERTSNNHDQIIDSKNRSVLGNVIDVEDFRGEVHVLCSAMTASSNFLGGPYPGSKNENAFVRGDKVVILGKAPLSGSDAFVMFKVICRTGSTRGDRAFRCIYNKVEPALNKDSLEEAVVRFSVDRRGKIRDKAARGCLTDVYPIEFGRKKSGPPNIVWISARSTMLQNSPGQIPQGHDGNAEDTGEREEDNIEEGKGKGQAFPMQEDRAVQSIYSLINTFLIYYGIPLSEEQRMAQEQADQGQTSFLSPQFPGKEEERCASNLGREYSQRSHSGIPLNAVPFPPPPSYNQTHQGACCYLIPQNVPGLEHSITPPLALSSSSSSRAQTMPTTVQGGQGTRMESVSPPLASPLTPLTPVPAMVYSQIPQIPPALPPPRY